MSDPEQIPFMNVDQTDFATMSRAEQIRHLEVEGYLVLPRLLSADTVDSIKQEMSDAEMWHPDYSELQQRAVTQPQWASRTAAQCIGHPSLTCFLHDLMGPEIVFTRGFYQRSLPGCPGISMHTDGQPHGSDLFGYEGSCPRLMRVLIYLDDLSEQKAPFRVIPRSHLSFHADASPYRRYKWHPDELTIIVPAGSAVLVPSMLMHGSHPNLDNSPRELLQLGFRPAWAGPVQPVEEWDEALVEAAPVEARPYLRSLNTSEQEWVQPNKPVGMKTEAPGISPGRWGD